LTGPERAQIVAWLAREDYADLSVQQVFWRVLDAGHYIASMRTWYRVAAAERLVGDRRRQASHPPRTIPQLVSTGPDQVWSWDITRIRIQVQRTSLHLYLIEDVFSRKCVGWRLEHREQDALAAEMISTAIQAADTIPHTLHSDGGPSMTSTAVRKLLDQLGVQASTSRPHVSNDNPFSEALFKTLKYDLNYPGTFDDYAHAKDWIERFIHQYNNHHHHSGLAGFTPASVHDGSWTNQAQQRQNLLNDHYAKQPHRYRRPPTTATPPGTVWINPPQPEVSQVA
jgi:putative transposase